MSVSWMQGVVLLALGIAAVLMQVYSLVDAVRQRADAFTAAGKLSKQIWLMILGVAVALGFVTLFNPLSIFNLIAVVAAGVYLADVRPAVRNISRGGNNYGSW